MSPQQHVLAEFSRTTIHDPQKDPLAFANGPPKFTTSNPTLNGLMSLLLNATNSPNSSLSSLTDLFGPAISGLATNPANATVPATSLNSTRQARRLYIGSIPLGITSETMVTFFNAELQTRGLCQSVGEPVVCAQVNSERHFAFIELRSVEETTAALSLDGINCLGSTLRIRRPRDYFPPGMNPNIHLVGHLNSNSIFLTGIPTSLSDSSLCRLLSSYGTLRSFSILKDPLTALSRGCGFFEFTASESADLACLGLQNHPAGGGKFFAIRADHLLIPPPATSASLPEASLVAPTTVLCLSNMVSPRDIESPEEYADVLEDVRSECLRHGAVLSMHMPQPNSAPSSAHLGKIFVEFATVQQAQAASVALNGRKYNGRTVSTSFFDARRYAAGDF
ncbi:unnamed protein product [Mesocestoides corti]|nr:unnamed protein product [Mesocestoides corti]